MVKHKISLNTRKMIYLIVMARDSVNEALATINTAIEKDIQQDSPFFTPLQSAVAISYGRVFAKIEYVGKLSDDWSKFDTAQRQKTHDWLIYTRDKFVAHSDHFPDRVLVYPAKTVRGDGSTSEFISCETLAYYYTSQDYMHVQDLCIDLATRLHIELSDQLNKAYGDLADFIEPHKLLTDEELGKVVK